MNETQGAQRAWGPRGRRHFSRRWTNAAPLAGGSTGTRSPPPSRDAKHKARQCSFISYCPPLVPAQPPRRRVASPEGAMVAFLPIPRDVACIVEQMAALAEMLSRKPG